MKDKLIWFDGRNLEHPWNTITLLNNLRFEHLVIKNDFIKEIENRHNMSLIIEATDNLTWSDLPLNTIILSDNGTTLAEAQQRGYRTAYYTLIRSYTDMEEAWKVRDRNDFLVVELADETNIPLELLIAGMQGIKTKLLKVVDGIEDAKVAFGVMEAGCDGVLVRTEEVGEIMAFDSLMAKKETGKVELSIVKVVNVQHVGMGNRVCIDTTSLMTQSEGMIIGSTSYGGLLVSSETHHLPYMELRPFRVNAGAVHSYVWTPDDSTVYLTELKSGSKVLCVDIEGNTREVYVGRAKIELRPLLKIEAEYQDIVINTIVQDDWHIRIFGGDGTVRNASAIKIGDELLAYICKGGRHVGIKIDERFEEK